MALEQQRQILLLPSARYYCHSQQFLSAHLHAYTLWKPILQTILPRSDCPFKSSLIRFHSVCFHNQSSLKCIWKFAAETVLLSTQNICFSCEKRKLCFDYALLSGCLMLAQLVYNDTMTYRALLHFKLDIFSQHMWSVLSIINRFQLL